MFLSGAHSLLLPSPFDIVCYTYYDRIGDMAFFLFSVLPDDDLTS